MPSPTTSPAPARTAAAHRPATRTSARLRRAGAATTAAFLLLAATACSSTSSSSSAFLNWWNKGGKQNLNTLRADARAQGRAPDLNAMYTACTVIPGHIQAARQYGPIPDKAAQDHWSKYLDSYEAAAKDCITGTKNHDTARLEKLTNELTAAQDEEDLLQARIGELGTKV
ncbi:hypothetical protein [Kitasatospora paranensis]|uniref:Lipoprotein n=1 Tax=Kitasatospora paranensis TaxID=258053 RepID=A0ABW2GCR1_9ACTN